MASPSSGRRVRPGRRSAEDIACFDVADGPGADSAGPAQEAWIQMREITHPPRMLEASAELARELGVPHGAIRALRPLAGSKTTTMSGLAAQLRCDGSYVTGLIDVLEEAGLAERRSDVHDRRVKVVGLTDEGREAARRACALIFTPPESFSVLTRNELEQLVGLLRKLGSAQRDAETRSARQGTADPPATETAPEGPFRR